MSIGPATSGLFSPPPRSSVASLLAVDPDLGRGLDPEQGRQAARGLPVRLARLPAGAWVPRTAAGTAALGFLIADGLIVREAACGGGSSAELLGAGDVIRPWEGNDFDGALVAPAVSWYVADEACVALLDSGLAAALGEWPAVLSELFARAMRRAQWQAFQRSIGQVRRLDERTLLYLWHVGERFGRVTPAGVVVRLPLTHERLAPLVGAHRPSVTTALRSLERDELLVRRDDREMVLTPDARDAVERLAGRVPALAA